MTIRESVTAILDSSPGETLSLWALTDAVALAVGWRVMPHTVRRACKLYADRAGGEFYCVDPVHGQYRYVPGVKIGAEQRGRENLPRIGVDGPSWILFSLRPRKINRQGP